MDYKNLMAEARETNRKRDRIDHSLGFAPPSQASVMDELKTAMMAIECGIVTEDWSNIAEGQAMLESVVERFDAVVVVPK